MENINTQKNENEIKQEKTPKEKTRRRYRWWLRRYLPHRSKISKTLER